MDLKKEIVIKMVDFIEDDKLSIESIDELKNVLETFLIRGKSNHEINQVLNAGLANLEGILKSEEYIRDDLKIHSAVRTAKFIASRLDCLDISFDGSIEKSD